MLDSDRTTCSGDEPSPRAVTVPLMATVLCAQEEILTFPLTLVLLSEGEDPAGVINSSGWLKFVEFTMSAGERTKNKTRLSMITTIKTAAMMIRFSPRAWLIR